MANNIESILRFLLGRPLTSGDDEDRKIGVVEGVPAFGLDGLSSSAYGPEAALTMLTPLGVAGLWYIGPTMLAILLLLALLYLSYRQTIATYPVNGGSYTVAKDNLGINASLLAAAALMIDYVLTAAVGISAGVAALISAVPALHPYTLPLCLVVLVIITLVNLRGTKDASQAFALPTYLFIGSLAVVLAMGIIKVISGGGHPQPLIAPPGVPRATEAVGLWILLRAFASGCTAMTGVEAVSNGVSAFKDPPVKYAHWTLTVIVAILAVLLGGVAYLAQAYEIGAMDQQQADYQSVLSQLTAAVVGRGWIYYITIGSVLVVLCLSANTSFADFPRLCRLAATDDFLPRSFAIMGRRLVFSMGILSLSTAAGLLLFVFDGITDRLIPLYAVGAFTAFTLSQAGMVVHWLKRLRGHEPHLHKAHSPATGSDQPISRHAMTIRLCLNAVGAIGTGIALAIILAAKFVEGAWITIVVVPLLITLFKLVQRYYRMLERQVGTAGPLDFQNNSPPVVVVPIRSWNKLEAKSLRFAMWLSPDVIAVHLVKLSGDAEIDAHDKLKQKWVKNVEGPSRAAGASLPQLRVVDTPYRTFTEPLLDEVKHIEGEFPGRLIAVIIPTLVGRHWWQILLHTRHLAQLRSALMKCGDHQVVVINVPWFLKDGNGV